MLLFSVPFFFVFAELHGEALFGSSRLPDRAAGGALHGHLRRTPARPVPDRTGRRFLQFGLPDAPAGQRPQQRHHAPRSVGSLDLSSVFSISFILFFFATKNEFYPKKKKKIRGFYRRGGLRRGHLAQERHHRRWLPALAPAPLPGRHRSQAAAGERVSSCFSSFYQVLLGFTGFYQVSSGFTRFYWVLLGFTGLNRVLLGFPAFFSGCS